MCASEDAMVETTSEHIGKFAISATNRSNFNVRTLLLAVLPLLLLSGVLAAIIATDAGLGDRNSPPIESLSVQRVRLPEAGLVQLNVFNGGPDPISIAQV